MDHKTPDKTLEQNTTYLGKRGGYDLWAVAFPEDIAWASQKIGPKDLLIYPTKTEHDLVRLDIYPFIGPQLYYELGLSDLLSRVGVEEDMHATTTMDLWHAFLAGAGLHSQTIYRISLCWSDE